MHRPISLSKDDPRNVFFTICLCFLAVSAICLALTRRSVWSYFLFLGGNDAFMDFFNHVVYCDSPGVTYFVSPHACFPPFAYLFYYAVNRCLPHPVLIQPIGQIEYLVFLLYNLFLFLMLFELGRRYLKQRPARESSLLCVLILCSTVFVAGVIERGNSVLVVLVLLLFAMHYYDAPDKRMRELAMVAIAFASGLKLYPAVFGLLYLFDRRYRDALRLILYGLLTFFVPFLFFGGIDGLRQFFLNQATIQGNLFSAFSLRALVGALLGEHCAPAAATVVFAILSATVGLLCLLGAYRTKRQATRCALLVSVMVFCPVWSGEYTLSYYLIPLVMTLADDTPPAMPRTLQMLYATAYALLFSLTMFPPIGTFSFTWVFCYLGAYGLMLLSLYETLFLRERTGVVRIEAASYKSSVV